MTHRGRIETRHPTSEAIRKLDQTQSGLDQGPCVTALEDLNRPGCGGGS